MAYIGSRFFHLSLRGIAIECVYVMGSMRSNQGLQFETVVPQWLGRTRLEHLARASSFQFPDVKLTNVRTCRVWFNLTLDTVGIAQFPSKVPLVCSFDPSMTIARDTPLHEKRIESVL